MQPSITYAKPGFRTPSGSKKAVKDRIGLMVEGQKRFIKYHFTRIESFRCCVDTMSGQEGRAARTKIRDLKEDMVKAIQPLEDLMTALDTTKQPDELKRIAIRARDTMTKTIPKLSGTLREEEDHLNDRANDIMAVALTDQDELTVKLAKLFTEPTNNDGLSDLR